MNNIQKRFILFLFGCISVRFLFVVIAKKINKAYLPMLGGLALIPAAGFLVIYLGGYRKTGGETFNQKIWWNNLRPIHSFLYFSFAFLAFNKSDKAFIPLLLDVSIGLLSFLKYHSEANSFKKLW
jgi:hypothetical protein